VRFDFGCIHEQGEPNHEDHRRSRGRGRRRRSRRRRLERARPRVDAAVAAGKLTPEQGARLKERIAKAGRLGLGAVAGSRKAFAERPGRLHAKGPAATYLGMTRQALLAELRKGQSLAQIAKAHGKTVDGLVAAMVAPLKARLAKAVEHDRLTKQRADALLERITDRLERLVQRSWAPRAS